MAFILSHLLVNLIFMNIAVPHPDTNLFNNFRIDNSLPARYNANIHVVPINLNLKMGQDIHFVKRLISFISHIYFYVYVYLFI